jgi:hypothetical protein
MSAVPGTSPTQADRLESAGTGLSSAPRGSPAWSPSQPDLAALLADGSAGPRHIARQACRVLRGEQLHAQG